MMFFFASRRRHTRCALVTGVQTCALPISSLYRSIREQLTDPKNQSEIRKAFPKQSIDRRNTGYALDLLLGSTLFSGERGQGAGHSQGTSHGQDEEIGRESGRERVCQYG